MDSPTHNKARAPVRRARSITCSLSPSNAGSARWTWLSTNVAMERLARGHRSWRLLPDVLLALFGQCPLHALALAIPARPLLLEQQQDRRSDVDRAECADDDAEQQHQGEGTQ